MSFQINPTILCFEDFSLSDIDQCTICGKENAGIKLKTNTFFCVDCVEMITAIGNDKDLFQFSKDSNMTAYYNMAKKEMEERG